MGRRVEAVGHYVRSVAERSSGYRAFRGGQEYIRLSRDLPQGRGRELFAGMYLGFLQFPLPASINQAAEFLSGRTRDTGAVFALKEGVGTLLDTYISWVLPVALSHSPTEFLAWKGVGSVAAIVGSDLVNAGISGTNRLLRNFRPSATTLVV